LTEGLRKKKKENKVKDETKVLPVLAKEKSGKGGHQTTEPWRKINRGEGVNSVRTSLVGGVLGLGANQEVQEDPTEELQVFGRIRSCKGATNGGRERTSQKGKKGEGGS